MEKKDLTKRYKQTLQPMGIFQVTNVLNGKIFIDSGLNVQGRLNSCKFQLSTGSHMNRALQEDVSKLGIANFAFEVIDILEPKDEPDTDHARDLKALEYMWLEKLQPYDERGYNKRKRTG